MCTIQCLAVIPALDAADACAANLGAAGNVVNKLANLRNLLNRADFDCSNGPAFSQSNDCDCVENAANFVKNAVSGSKANLVKQANRSANKLIKRLKKTYCTNEPVFNPANQGAPHPIGNKPADPQDPRPADHQGPGINGNGVDGMNVGSGTFNKDLSVWHGNDDVGTLTCSGDGCDNLDDGDLATSWANGSSLQVDFDCINFHEIVWWATDYPNQDAYRNVCLWVDDVEIHCWSSIRETVVNDRLVGSNDGVMMPNVQKVELRWDGVSGEAAELKVRYEGCSEEPSNNPYAVPESAIFNPANVGGPGPIGPIPENPTDPRPPGYQGPGINGNGLDGMNVGSGTFNKEVKVWKSNDSVGTVSCTGGTGCENLTDGDSDTNFAGGSQLQVDFDCINFHEIVFWADLDYPTQSSYQGLCLWVDDVKIHCWSDERVTPKYDRLVGSNKGNLMKNVQKVELRWADGSLSEVSKLRVRYEDCDPVDPNNPYASLGDSDVFQPANQGAPGIQGVKPENPEDPRPDSHRPTGEGGDGQVGNGFGTGGFNGNGLDGINIGSGTFKGMLTWSGEDNGVLTCNGGTGCNNMLDGDINSDFAGGSSFAVEFECINFHEIVFWAKNENPVQASYQGLCLWVDDEKVHCWSEDRYTPPYDRLVGSAKGNMVPNASKIELRWADGAYSEVPRMKIRYEECY